MRSINLSPRSWIRRCRCVCSSCRERGQGASEWQCYSPSWSRYHWFGMRKTEHNTRPNQARYRRCRDSCLERCAKNNGWRRANPTTANLLTRASPSVPAPLFVTQKDQATILDERDYQLTDLQKLVDTSKDVPYGQYLLSPKSTLCMNQYREPSRKSSIRLLRTIRDYDNHHRLSQS